MPCLGDTNFLDQWIQRSICLCSTIAIYCLSICLAEGFCGLIPACSLLPGNLEPVSDFKGHLTPMLLEGFMLLLLQSYSVISFLFVLISWASADCWAPFSSAVYVQICLWSRERWSFFISTDCCSKKKPHFSLKSLKENGISCVKTDGCKMHVAVMFTCRLKKALGYLECAPILIWYPIKFYSGKSGLLCAAQLAVEPGACCQGCSRIPERLNFISNCCKESFI